MENSNDTYTPETIEEKAPPTVTKNENNEDQTIYTSTNSKMSKTSKIVMFVSLALSLIFLIFGIVTLNGGCGGKNKELKISVHEGLTFNSEFHDYYTVSLEIDYYDNYIINLDGASLTSVRDDYNNTESFFSRVNTSYDYSYSIELSPGTYQLKLYARSEEVYIIVS